MPFARAKRGIAGDIIPEMIKILSIQIFVVLLRRQYPPSLLTMLKSGVSFYDYLSRLQAMSCPKLRIDLLKAPLIKNTVAYWNIKGLTNISLFGNLANLHQKRSNLYAEDNIISAIYLDGASGNDVNDSSSAILAVRTFFRAHSWLQSAGGNSIFVIGSASLNNANELSNWDIIVHV